MSASGHWYHRMEKKIIVTKEIMILKLLKWRRFWTYGIVILKNVTLFEDSLEGYGPEHDTWEPIDNSSDCQQKVKEFVEKGYKRKILLLSKKCCLFIFFYLLMAHFYCEND